MRSPWSSEELLETENSHFQFSVGTFLALFLALLRISGDQKTLLVWLPWLLEDPPGVTLLHLKKKSGEGGPQSRVAMRDTTEGEAGDFSACPLGEFAPLTSLSRYAPILQILS